MGEANIPLTTKALAAQLRDAASRRETVFITSLAARMIADELDPVSPVSGTNP